jgi:hypothetical protein
MFVQAVEVVLFLAAYHLEEGEASQSVELYCEISLGHELIPHLLAFAQSGHLQVVHVQAVDVVQVGTEFNCHF